METTPVELAGTRDEETTGRSRTTDPCLLPFYISLAFIA